MFSKPKKIVLLFSIIINITFFVSPVFAACPQGNVLVIGDSLGKGIGDKLASDCPNVKVKAVVGADTNAIVNQFNTYAKGFNTIIVMGGYNDAHNGIKTDTTLNNLKSIYSQAQDQKMTVVALTVPEVGNNHPELVTAINSGINGISGINILDSASMWAKSGNVHNSNSYAEVTNAIQDKNYSPGTGQGQAPTGSTPITAPPVTAGYERSSSLITGNDACEIWKNAFNLGISFIGVAALAGVIWGGFSYMTSYGNQERITSAKETIWGSVVGMIIGLFAYVLFNMVNPYVLECKIEVPFKLSVSSSGQTPGNGQPPGNGPSLPEGQRKEIKECSIQFKQIGKYDQAIQDSASRHQLDPHFLKGIIQTESGYGQNIGPSPTGAYGISQFQPSSFISVAPADSPASCKRKSSTANATDGYCRSTVGNPQPGCCTIKGKYKICEVYAPDCAAWIRDNPVKMIEAAATYLQELRGKFQGDYSKAASAYNGGPGNYNIASAINYANTVAGYSEKNCQESGGSW